MIRNSRRKQLGFVASHLFGFQTNNRRYIYVNSDTADLNVATTLNSPTGPVEVVLFIASGVNVYGSVSGASQPGLDCSGLASGSNVIIINNGKFWGKGGNGGNASAGAGVAGGDAIKLGSGVTAIIHNGNGNIWGGGGGGGAGAQAVHNSGCATTVAGGGGGGGGQGFAGGSAGSASANSSTIGCAATITPSNGGAGSSAGAGGGGGAGQIPQTILGKTCQCDGINLLNGVAGAGGGLVGAVGGTSSGGGGAAGKAINLNGGTATFIDGNNGTQVKGAVS